MSEKKVYYFLQHDIWACERKKKNYAPNPINLMKHCKISGKQSISQLFYVFHHLFWLIF